MEAILVGLVELVLYGLFAFPGAVIRWVFTEEKTVKEVYKENMYMNGFVGVGFFSVLLALGIYFFNLPVENAEVEVKLTEIQNEIDQAALIYSQAINDYEDGEEEKIIIDKYGESIKSTHLKLNQLMTAFGVYCKDQGLSENEYMSFLKEIDNSELLNQSGKLEKMGVDFKLD